MSSSDEFLPSWRKTYSTARGWPKPTLLSSSMGERPNVKAELLVSLEEIESPSDWSAC